SDDMEKFEISLPHLEIQNKIVLVLDKFQKLLDETNGLLPEEIEQRRKQYEFYREKFLTFEIECDSKQVSKQASNNSIISKEFFKFLYQGAEIVGIELKDKVEWKTLGEIGVFINGNGMPKAMFDENGTVGAIHYGHIYTQYNHFVYNPVVKIKEKDSVKLKKVNTGDLVIARTSENIEDVMKTIVYLGKEEVVVGGHSAIYKHNQNPKYMAYLFNGSKDVIKQKNKLCRGVKVIEISTSDMEKIKIPVPPLETQKYIVEILDKFHNLINDITQGLPKEIELREKQYIYYREKLLDFKK
ncbi:MAG: restriction endonuclease subunit S, partial [Fusobacterium sp.]